MERVLHLHLPDDQLGPCMGSSHALVWSPPEDLPMKENADMICNRRFTQTTWYIESPHQQNLIITMLVWIFVSKMVKIAPHFFDHPFDLFWLPAYLAFAYWHSFVKLYCALTFWNHSWSGRDLTTLTKASVNNIDKEDLMKIIPARPDMPRGITGLYSDDSTPLRNKQTSQSLP